MSYAVKIGTKSAYWIGDESTPAGHVRYDGDITEDHVWGADVGNLRAPNAAEIAAKQAAADQKVADQAAQQLEIARAKQAYANLQTIVDGIDAANLAQAKAAIKQLAQITQGLIRATVGK